MLCGTWRVPGNTVYDHTGLNTDLDPLDGVSQSVLMCKMLVIQDVRELHVY